MRTYPTLTEQATSRDFIEAFGGYNHNLRIGENEFYDMKNLSSSNYPVLSTRPKRATFRDYTRIGYTPVGFIDKDGLWSFEVSRVEEDLSTSLGTLLRLPGNKVYFLGKTDYDASHKRTLISMGAYIVILPDKKYVNTADIGKIDEAGNEIGLTARNIEASFTSEANTEGIHATYNLCKADGTAYEPKTTSDTEPTGVANGHMWLDTSVVPNSLPR